MKGSQQKINKSIIALKQRGRIILISPKQFYSKKLEKVCICYEITESTPKIKELKEIEQKKRRKHKKDY